MSEMSLDEQCAREMGWVTCAEELRGEKPKTYAQLPPRYSTDPALLDAKLEWLVDKDELGEVTLVVRRPRRRRGAWVGLVDRLDLLLRPFSRLRSTPKQAIGLTEASIIIRAELIKEWGTIHEATARLVVAVAERLREEKKP